MVMLKHVQRIMGYDHWIIQVGRGLRRSLEPPSAQSRATCEIRKGCSGLCPETPQERSLHNLPVPLLMIFMGEKVFSDNLLEPLLF